MNSDCVFTTNKVIKYVPEQSVLQLTAGDKIRLNAAAFERLAKGFLAEIQARFR